MTENDMAAAIFDAARIGGWRAIHHRPARTQHGWRTPYTGDTGWPDFVLCRPPELLIVELKTARGTLGPGQQEWIEALQQAGVEAFVLQPDDLDWLLHRLLTRTEQRSA
jgi:hypothetical protein